MVAALEGAARGGAAATAALVVQLFGAELKEEAQRMATFSQPAIEDLGHRLRDALAAVEASSVGSKQLRNRVMSNMEQRTIRIACRFGSRGETATRPPGVP